MSEYRIWRYDNRNIVIQKWRISEANPPGYWVTKSYHGNSVSSLVSGLLELIIAQHIPADVKLSEQLEGIESTIVSGVEEIKRIVNGIYR